MDKRLASGRTLDQWRGMSPGACAKGSNAQVVYALADARTDILELSAEVDRLRARLAEMVNPETHRAMVRDAVQRACDAGRADGYRAGAFDALCPVAPDHAKALSFGPDAPA